MSEEELLDKIFEPDPNYKGYKLSYCNLCECFTLACEECQNGSCSGGGCEKCHDVFTEFLKKNSVTDYLTPEEIFVFRKINRLKKFMKACYLEGFPEINWEYIGTEGKSCRNDDELFPQLKEFPYKNEHLF